MATTVREGVKVELGPEGFKVNGQTRPLVAAQFEPFRHNPLFWRRCLEAIKGAGIDLVSIFICWDFHEPERGRFDFTGSTNPARDLKGFLELCQEMGMLVLARPGPIIDAEWETRGPAKDVMRLDRLHPRFQERMREYVNAVCGVLAPAQVSHGGPVALLGVDNEILFPYNTPEVQFAVDGDVYIPYDDAYYAGELRAWLQQRFASVEALNEATGTSFRSWEQVRSARFGEDPPAYAWESFRFIDHRIKEFTRVCRDMYREAGMEVPTYTNMKQLLAYIDWPAVAPELDSIGMNLCMPRDMPGDQAVIANWWYRLHRARFPFTWAAEFQSGWIGLDDKFGFITEAHSEYMPMSAQAAGLRGLNFFMFIEREDWTAAPVNVNGKIRQGRYERFKRVVSSYRGLNPTDEHLADVGLIWNQQDHQSIYIGSDRDWSTLPDHWLTVDEAKEPPAWWATFRALLDADVDFRLWIPGVSPGNPPRIMVHAGLPVATRQHYQALRDLVEGAQSLITVTPLATRGLNGEPDLHLHEYARDIEESGKTISAQSGEVVALLTSLGARLYARSGKAGVWSYVYRDPQDAVVLGVWNSLPDAYRGRVRLNQSLFDSSSRWEVEEPRLHSRAAVQVAEAASFPVELEPRSARVFRFRPR
jgi:glycosyl hydrolase family 35